MLKVYKKIKELRLARGWSQDKLAQLVGYADKSMISRIENGKVDLSLPQLEEFAKIFGVPSADLIGAAGEEEDTAYYVDDYVRDLARFLHQNPEYRVAFDATRKVKAEDLETVINVLDKFRDVQ